MTKWISSSTARRWHLATKKELRGARTGAVMSRYLVTACAGRQLGGAYGYTIIDEPPFTDVCPRCRAIFADMKRAAYGAPDGAGQPDNSNSEE